MTENLTERAEAFADFWARLDPRVQEKERDDLTESPARIFLEALFKPRGDIQAVFLRQKPMAWLKSETPLGSEEFGLRQWEDFLYDPALIQQVMDRYPEVFADYDSIESLLTALKISKKERHVERGLVLGIPKTACVRFSQGLKEPKIRVSHGFYDYVTGTTGVIEASGGGELIKKDYETGQLGVAFRAFGVSWVDYKDQDMNESYDRLYRLREAFITSKILKVGLI